MRNHWRAVEHRKSQFFSCSRFHARQGPATAAQAAPAGLCETVHSIQVVLLMPYAGSGPPGPGRRSPGPNTRMAEEPPKEDFSVGPLSLLAESVKKNCQVSN